MRPVPSNKITMLLAAALYALFSFTAASQPMSGTYTVGGNAPDFLSPQAAVQALKDRGVSGPVFLNIRPGTYSRDGGTSPVFVLDSVVAGVSPANRITIQSDEAAGGNADNVILQVDQETQLFNLAVARVLVDYVTIRNLSLKDKDSLQAGATYLLAIDPDIFLNPSVEGLIIEGCNFIGNPNNVIDANLGTDFGIHTTDEAHAEVTVRDNNFTRLRRAISISYEDPGDVGGIITVEDNVILAGHLGITGTGNPIGGGIQVGGTTVTVRRNLVDFAGGNGSANGIGVRILTTGRVEQNYVKNAAPPSPPSPFNFAAIDVGEYIFQPADSVLVANNMVSGTTHGTRVGLRVKARYSRIIHNTIVHPFGIHLFNPSWCLAVAAENCTVLNNIVIDYGINAGVTVYDQITFGSATGLVSDHNIFFGAPDGNVVRDFNGAFYASLADYQAATGFDTSSHEKELTFLDLVQDVHIGDCQAQDADLAGTPVPDVPIDYDGGSRSTVAPIIGADEVVGSAHDLFGDVFRIVNPGAAFSADAGLLNNIVANSLAIPEWDSSRVNVLDYVTPRQYVFEQRWPTNECQPTVVKVADMDLDGNRDIVIACSGSPLTVFYILGGAAGILMEIGTGNTRSVEVADVNIDGLPDIVATQGDPVAYVNDSGQGLFVPFVLANASDATGDILVRDLDGDADPDIVVMNETPLPQTISVYLNLGVNGGVWDGFGDETQYQFQTGSGTDASSIADGDFDEDGDVDLILTHAASDSLVFLVNNGNATFTRQAVLALNHKAVAALDYDNDGDLDIAVTHLSLSLEGFSIYFNEGNGTFIKRQNCFVSNLVNGVPTGLAARFLDFDDLPDLIVTTVDTVFVLFNLGGGATGVDESSPVEIPVSISLSQNYPNPFNPATTIEYFLPSESRVLLKVYDVLGQEVATLVDGLQPAGSRRIEWRASGVASGVYFYRIEGRPTHGSTRYSEIRKMIVVR